MNESVYRCQSLIISSKNTTQQSIQGSQPNPECDVIFKYSDTQKIMTALQLFGFTSSQSSRDRVDKGDGSLKQMLDNDTTTIGDELNAIDNEITTRMQQQK